MASIRAISVDLLIAVGVLYVGRGLSRMSCPASLAWSFAVFIFMAPDAAPAANVAIAIIGIAMVFYFKGCPVPKLRCIFLTS